MEKPQASRFPAIVHQLAWAIAGLALFLVALWILHREVAGVHFADVVMQFRAVPWNAVLIALGFTFASYAALSGYDWLALRYIGHRLPYADVALTSFVATAVGHNLGAAMLSGGAVRYRLYSAAGLSAAEVATVIGMIGLAFGLGVSFVVGLILLLATSEAALVLHLPVGLLQVVGVLILTALLGYAAWGALWRAPLRLRNWQLAVPRPSITSLQLLFALADIAFAAGVLFALLPAELGISYPQLLSIYVLAISAGILSHVPGGLGVFESVLLLSLPDAPRDVLLGAVLAYRALYYLLPLLLAALLGITRELHIRRAPIGRGLALAGTVVGRISPQLLAALTFVAGAVLVFSGATPGQSERIELVGALLPLPVLEISHMTASLAGLALMVLSQGLYRRVNVAYHLAFWTLLVGVVTSLGKGLDYEEATIAAVALGALHAGRDAFRRDASLIALPMSAGWIALVMMALGGSLWLGLFAYRHVDYSQQLWWQFALQSDAPRFLRATLVVVVAGTLYALVKLLRPRPSVPRLPDKAALDQTAALVANSPHADAALALVGDKRLLFSAMGDGFMMYQVRGRSWIAMGDPIGCDATREALAWEFRELCDRHGEHFYNFEGLRAYKAKFQPEWRPKYLAAPRGLGLPAVLLDVSALISGGLKGVLTR